MGVSVPQIGFRYMEYNRGNPFKKLVRRTHLFCKVCGETVLTHSISKLDDWSKIRGHLKEEHGLEVGEDVPVRLLSLHLFKRVIAPLVEAAFAVEETTS